MKLYPNSKDAVWAALAAPLDKSAISWRQDGKPSTRDGRHYARFVCYVEAGTVRERLDAVVPGEWDLTLEMLPQTRVVDSNGIESMDSDSAVAFKSRLQVLGVIREDVGTGKDYKSAATDAFKRAAVRFGIAHELYSYEQNWVEVDGDGKYAKPAEDPQTAYERRHGQNAPNVAQRNADAGAKLSQGRATNEARAKAAGLDDDDPNVTQEEAEAVSCPKCGGRMWDGRLTKRNPKAPDWKCKDRSCGGVIWPPRNGAARDTGMDQDSYEPPTDDPFDENSLPF